MPDPSEALDVLLSPMLLISMVVLLFCVIVAPKDDGGRKVERADRNREARDRYDEFLREKAKMKTNDILEKLDNILGRAISGKIDLECRKKLSQGEAVKLTVQEQQYIISVDSDEAILKSGHRVLIKKEFVPWGKADEDYEAMIKSFDGKSIDPEWFERASENFHSRFE